MRFGWVVIAVALLVAGCGDRAEDRRTAPDPAAPAANLWDPALPADVALEEAPPLLPGSALPPETILTRATQIEPRGYVGKLAERAAQTLYADPAVADPAEGRQVVVTRTSIDDIGLPYDEGATKLEVQGNEGHVARRGPGWAVSWYLDIELDCECAQVATVAVSGGLTKQDALRLAAVARPQDPRPAVPAAALPPGLRSLGTAAGDESGLSDARGGWLLQFDIAGLDLALTGYRGDPRIAAHLRFWDDVNPGRRIISTAGQVVVADLGPSEGDATAAELDALDVDAIVASLRPASVADLVDRAHDVITRPQDAADRCDVETPNGPEPTFFAGSDGEVRWVFGVVEDGGRIDMCDEVLGADLGPSAGGGSNVVPPAGPTEIRLVSGTGMSNVQGVGYVIGDAPAGATRIEVAVGDLHGTAQLAATGPADDRRWFVAVFPHPPVSSDAVVAVASDDAGREVARTR